MAITEITKILFRRGAEKDRRELQNYGGLAQGEPGFTSSEGWSVGLGLAPELYDPASGFLNPADVVQHPSEGGGDFFVGGSQGQDIYIGGTSAEKHWQRRFVSLSGTGCNTQNTFIDGQLDVGEADRAPGLAQNVYSHPWDVTFYGESDSAITGSPRNIGSVDYATRGHHKVHWEAGSGIFNVNTTCAFGLPVGYVTERPGGSAAAPGSFAQAGNIRFNLTDTTFEGYDGSSWGSLGGAADVAGQTYITVLPNQPTWSNGLGNTLGSQGEIKFVVGTGGGPTATLAGKFDNNKALHVEGTGYFKEDIVAFDSSDERQKDNVLVIDNPIKKLGQLRGVEFDWNEDGPMWIGEDRHDVGVLAQDVEKIIPSAVTTRDDGFKAVDYKRIVPLLIESVKELTARVEELESQK